MTNLTELLQHEVQQLNAAESKLFDELPTLARSTTHAHLQQAMLDYQQQLKVRVERLNMVASLLGVNPTDRKNKSIKGLLKEAGQLANLQVDFQVKDAALVAVMQKMMHYKIATYGTARHYADALNLTEEARVLSQSLEEEKAANQLLNDLAINEVNPLALGRW